ncbi:MAG: hypothetical protein Q7U84_03615 [Polynucleobacter sp.]|nr:hypothetical protein [Polynucleobacter sp.]
MSYANNAYKCFNENLQAFGDATTQPEKYNLYNGLSNLARAMKEMQDEMDRLRREVDYLRRAA